MWLHGHADIGELAGLVDAATHMDVLFEIRQGINPLAEQLLGRPILVFQESGFDWNTGAMVPFSWWLAGRAVAPVARPAPRVEIMDEGAAINVLAELPGVAEEAIRFEAGRRRLTIWAEGAEDELRQVISLPAPVSARPVTACYNNGILLVSLQKARRGGSA